MDQQVLKDQRVLRVFKVPKVFKVSLDQEDLRGHKGQNFKELKVLKVP